MASKDRIHLISLLKCLLGCSERACRIAQVCRSDKELFSLLIQEKKVGEKNMRFCQDFKTLADVLIQETVRWEVTNKFPSLHSNIHGEESNHFQNTLGESIDVQISDSVEETSNLLFTVLDERRESANRLASIIYEDIDVDLDLAKYADVFIPENSIGIWIDPIDSTGQYVKAKKEMKLYDFATVGFECVCVLIGVYNLQTGEPIMGIINQPFYKSSLLGWLTKYYWGILTTEMKETSFIPKPMSKKTKVPLVAISGAESTVLVKLMRGPYGLITASGSGYKSILVICRNVQLYVLSQPTIFYWDTCGPHAVLLALGGGIIDFEKSVALAGKITEQQLPSLQLKYNEPSAGLDKRLYCNSGGVIAYLDPHIVIEFLRHLASKGYKTK